MRHEAEGMRHEAVGMRQEAGGGRHEAKDEEHEAEEKLSKIMGNFRFEDLQIWQKACAIGDQLDVISDDLEKRGKRRYAEQLRGAALSVSNNIAEGSGLCWISVQAAQRAAET